MCVVSIKVPIRKKSCCVNTLVCLILLWSNKCRTTMLRLLLLYQSWLTEIYICRKPRPTRDYKLHSQWCSCFCFSILSVLYTQDTLVLNFEIGHFARHFLFHSFSVAMKGIQFTQLHCHISFLLFIWLTTCFLSSCGLARFTPCKQWLFRLHIQHATHL